MRTKTGSYRHYDVRAVPIERDGAIVEWMGASTDVTSQREADEMRGRLTEQLSAAALRTSRLQQATSLLRDRSDIANHVRSGLAERIVPSNTLFHRDARKFAPRELFDGGARRLRVEDRAIHRFEVAALNHAIDRQ